MQARAHLLIGAASPVGAVLAGATPTQCMVLSVIGAGASLGPDLDHPSAAATQLLGPRLHRIVHRVSESARVGTSTGRDRRDSAWRVCQERDPDHRGLTHTAVAAAVAGLAAAALSEIPGGTSVIVLLALLGCQHPFRLLRRRRGASQLPLVLAMAAVSVALGFGVDPPSGLVGAAAAAGWLSHVLADGCTKDGVPLLWPLSVRGKRWYRVRLLGTVLSSGGRGEWWAAGVMAALLASPVTLLVR